MKDCKMARTKNWRRMSVEDRAQPIPGGEKRLEEHLGRGRAGAAQMKCWQKERTSGVSAPRKEPRETEPWHQVIQTESGARGRQSGQEAVDPTSPPQLHATRYLHSFSLHSPGAFSITWEQAILGLVSQESGHRLWADVLTPRRERRGGADRRTSRWVVR